jgi:hypothetical protein
LPGNTKTRGRLSTIDLLIRVACFARKEIMFSISKQLFQTSQYNELNCTEPSPSVSVPWFGIKHLDCEESRSLSVYQPIRLSGTKYKKNVDSGTAGFEKCKLLIEFQNYILLK